MAANYFDQFDEPSRQQGGNYFDRFDAVDDEPVAPRSGPLSAVSDSALALGGGLVRGVKALADVAGPDNAVSRGLGAAAEWTDENLSPERRAEMARRGEIIRRAEESGSTMEQIGAHIGAFAEAPIDTTLSSLGFGAPIIASAFIPGGAAAAGARMAAPVALGAAQGVGNVKGQIYDEVKAYLLSRGVSEEEAEQRAIEAQAYTGPNKGSLAVAAGLGAAAGGTGVERIAAGMIGRRVAAEAAENVAEQSALRAAGQGALAEAPMEMLQGGQERLAQNLALQEEGSDVPTWRGVVAQGVAEGVAAAPVGAAFGYAGRRRVARDPAIEALDTIAPAQTTDEAIEAAGRALDSQTLSEAVLDAERAVEAFDVGTSTAIPSPDSGAAGGRMDLGTAGLEDRAGADGFPAGAVDTGGPAVEPAAADLPQAASPAGPEGAGPDALSRPTGFRVPARAAADLPGRQAQDLAPEAPPATVEVTRKADGSMVLRGDTKQIMEMLAAQGLVGVPSRSGVRVARSGARDALELVEKRGPKPKTDAVPEVTQVVPSPEASAPAPAPAPRVRGARIDREWSAFTPQSGTRGVPRAEMPQIKAEHRGAMTNFLNARGIQHEQVEVPARDLKPTQAEFSPAKVERAKTFEGGDRSILISADGHILDGHHQWLAKLEAGEPVKAIRLDAPIDKLLAEVKEFPSATTAAGATEVQTQNEAEKTDAEERRQQAPQSDKAAASPAADQAPAAAGRAAGQQPRAVQPDRAVDGRPDADERAAVATGTEMRPAAADRAASTPEKIDDLGEKIGGARKDTAQPTGRAPRKGEKTDDRPTWARRYQINEIVAGNEAGRWAIRDTRALDWRNQPKQVGRATFESREAAERALPLLAVAQKHRVAPAPGKDGTQAWEIWRDISDRKRVKVVDQQFGSREDAMRYMAEHATEIIETNTTFGEADLPVPESKRREGPKRRQGDVKGEDFMQAFGFRGVEFGNWNNQAERQELMNEAYDGLMDLAEVMGIPPKAISLNGDLALAFGARGHGLSGARAHYEADRAVMNLTKMKGAGALAHEWFHALDHYFGRQDGKAPVEWVTNKDGTRSLKVHGDFGSDAVTSGFSRQNSGVREEVRQAYKDIMETMMRKAEKYVQDTAKVEQFVASVRENVETRLANIRRDLAEQKDVRYYKRNNKPASAEQLAEFDAIAQQIIEGTALDVDLRSSGTKGLSGVRWSNDHLEKLSSIYKAVRGRTGFDAEQSGVLDRLRQEMGLYSARLKMLAEAQSGEEKTKKVPTDFAMDAKSLDQGRGTDYWITPHEMAARAFQGYVEDKISERGGKSPFLNYGPENTGILTPWGVKRPYPAGEERKAINAAFDKLVDVIETRETDQGVAMFARGLTTDAFRRAFAPPAAMTVQRARQLVGDMTAKWTDGPDFTVVATAADLPMEAPADTRGWVSSNGRGYIVAANNPNREALARTLAHEAIGHYGLWKMLGEDGRRRFERNVQLALKAGNKRMAEIREKVRSAYRDEAGEYTLSPEEEANEIAAFTVEEGVDPVTGEFRPGFGWLKQFWARVAAWLRSKLGWPIKFTHAELQGMLVDSMRGLQAGHRLEGGAEVLVASARGDRPVQLPDVIVANELGAATGHPDYEAAKAGDVKAAVKVARALVTDDLVEKVRQAIGDSKPIIVPVVAEEAAGRNKIPRAAAEELARRLDLETAADIVQANRAHRTGMDGLDRIFAAPDFDGSVEAGSDYLLLDDTLTQGATFATLASHIQQGGGRVVGAVALTGKQYSAKMEASDKTLQQLRAKHGDLEDDFRAATGYGFDALTQSEARYLANFEPAQRLRDRISAEGRRARDAGNPPAPGGLDSALARGTTPPPSAPEQAESDKPNAWSLPADTRLDRFIYELQDARIDLKRIQQAVEKSGQKIAEQWDASTAETLYPGRVAHRSQQFLEAEVGPLLKSMAINKITMDEMADYLHARGAEERNAQIAKVNPDMPDGGAGKNTKGVLMTNKAAREYLATISQSRKKALEAVARRVDAITKGTRDLLVAEGLEKRATVEAWEKTYPNYVPMFRDDVDAEGVPHPQGSGFSVKGATSKRATGSTKEVTNIMSHVLMQREAAITRAEKNRVALANYGLALTHPNPEVWTTIRPSMSDAQIEREMKRMGVDPDVAMAGMERAPVIRTVGTDGTVVERPNPGYKNLPGAIVVKVNGEDRVLMYNTSTARGARLAASLKNLDGLTNFDLAGSIVGQATRWLAAVNTQYNPAFGLVNLARDVLGATINLGSTRLRGDGMKVLGGTVPAIRAIAAELRKPGSGGQMGKLWQQFQADGGKTGWKENWRDPNERARALEKELKAAAKAGKLTPGKVAHAALDLLDGFNTTLENAVRLSAYKAALDKGQSRAQAAKLARELTVDFNRKGRLGRELSPLYAFFNASVQGTARTMQTLKGPTGRRVIAGGLGLGVLQALALASAGYDDDELQDFTKSRAFIIPMGLDQDGKKVYAQIPLPLGLHVLPNTGRILTELLMSGGDDLGEKSFKAIAEVAAAMNPLGGGDVTTMPGFLTTLAPTVVDPAIELVTNKNFAGNDIERESFSETDTRPGTARARESTLRSTTGQVYTGIADAINTLTGGSRYEAGAVSWTPERYRYLAQTVGGGVLRELEKIVNGATGEEPVKPHQIPVAGRFYGEVDDEKVQTSRYYRTKEKVEQLRSTYNTIHKAGDVEAMAEFIRDNPEVMYATLLARIQRDITKLNKLAVTSIGDPAEMKAIDEARTELMKSANQAIEEMERARAPQEPEP